MAKPLHLDRRATLAAVLDPHDCLKMAQQQGSDTHCAARGETDEHAPQQDKSQSSAEDPILAMMRAKAGRRNIMLEKFEAVDYAELEEVNRKADIALEERLARRREAKELYFFYGSLMFPRMLQHVLDLPELPELKPAHVVGLHLKLWGPYPALVPGQPGEIVKGMAYEVETPEQKDKLAKYETECYANKDFFIHVAGEEESVLGTTFVWSGSADELDEGEFDVESWEKRMGRILDR